MAKLGEGDKRWIVEERKDGRNVNHWHWTEKDCLEWSRRRLHQLLDNTKVLDGEGNCWCQITEVDTVEGEAYVNIRKGKIIPGYELKVKLGWKGECKDGSGQSVASATGKVEVPYLADENADEDPELRITAEGEGPAHARLREAMLTKGRPLIQERIKTFVKEMKAGGPAKEELIKTSGDKDVGPKPKATSSLLDSAPKQASQQPARQPSGKGKKTLTMTEVFHCRASDLYDLLLDEKRWKAITQSSAQISRDVGGTFFLFDGAVTGINQELVENKMIVQKWRFNSWCDGQYSTVCMTLEESEVGRTVLRFTQTDVPDEDRYGNATVVENTERGWKDTIFQKIRAVFGYGL
eukprot:TRINITY_DN1700_c0_g2_i1.p1 TRINITY_DN1700_c0_g2~~TRINITY_DN1700_c0_g2_i1.p1  ORF type:complete len:372 (-),score=83.32 TRINITY_DN1700_c0_g2_i1:161-1213(-)